MSDLWHVEVVPLQAHDGWLLQALYTLTVNGVVQPGGGGTGSSAAVKARADTF